MTTTNGVDISTYQKRVNGAALQGSDVRFCIAKVTEGAWLVDDQWANNAAWMRAARGAGWLVPGAYHFADTTVSPEANADFFTSLGRYRTRPGGCSSSI
jgi:GH25 family lysozyme M1 (1,4-beta-N-acetylmuramidase)